MLGSHPESPGWLWACAAAPSVVLDPPAAALAAATAARTDAVELLDRRLCTGTSGAAVG